MYVHIPQGIKSGMGYCNRIGYRTLGGSVEKRRKTPAMGDGDAEVQRLTGDGAQRGDGGMAVAIKAADNFSLGADGDRGGFIVQDAEERRGLGIVAPALNRERALAGGGEHLIWLNRAHDARVV